MENISQAMYKKRDWNYLAQYSILKEMHKDLQKMIKKFWRIYYCVWINKLRYILFWVYPSTNVMF